MPSIPSSKYPEIKTMYASGATMLGIANHFKVPIDAVVYAMRKGKIPRRSMPQVQQLRFSQKAPSFQIKALKTEAGRTIAAVGVALYWGEGSKSLTAKSVDFANSDPVMIIYFMQFLRTCYHLDNERLRIYLYCYADQNIKTLMQFWSTITKIPIRQFSKPYVRRDYRENGRKMEHGLIHIRYADKKLLYDILGRIEVLKNTFNK